MSTFKTSTRHNKSNWNNYTRSNNKKPLKLKRVEQEKQQEKQQDAVVDKALEEAKRIADIANRATKKLANPNISVQKKRKVIVELTKELKQSVSQIGRAHV